MTDKETRFTQGPWHIVMYGDGTSNVISSDIDGSERVCFMATTGGHKSDNEQREIEANAALIAAAPDLYAALQGLVSTVLDYERVNNLSPAPGRKYCWDATEQAIAALSKARGEPSHD